MTEKSSPFIDAVAIDALVGRARVAPRLRQNLNLHPRLDDPIQRFLNAGEPGTYIRPHRHRPDRWEMVAVMRGRIDTMLFDDKGVITDRFVMEPGNGVIELPGGTWHSFVFALPGTVAIEIKPGPYDAALDKQFADWAPREEDADAARCAAWIASASVGSHYP